MVSKDIEYVIISQVSQSRLNYNELPSISEILNSIDKDIKCIEGPIIYQVLSNDVPVEFSRYADQSKIYKGDKMTAVKTRARLKYGNPMIIPKSSLQDFLNRIIYRVIDKEGNKLEYRYR